MNMLKTLLTLTACSLLLSGCITPAAIDAPRQTIEYKLPPTPSAVTILPGDSLRIVRDAASPAEQDDMTLFFVRPDGVFSYPHLGLIKAQGKTPEALADELTQQLASIYREPRVTVNIATGVANKVYVGGAVRNPGPIDLAIGQNVVQAIMSVGGVLPSADSQTVTLLRPDATSGQYNVYFINHQLLLQKHQPMVPLARGDIVYIPQSIGGKLADGVNLYWRQIIPFSQSFGIGINYDVKQ